MPPPERWSNCLVSDGIAYVSGMTARGTDPAELARMDEYEQAKLIFNKIKGMVEAAGGAMADVVKVTIYVTNIKNNTKVWAARREFFTGDFPASTLVEVSALAAPEILVEIEAEAIVEEKLYASGRGHIACLTLDASGRLLKHQVALQREVHLSYPFIFEHAGQLFMLPETAASRTVELYRCVQFPNQWELHATLMRDVYAVDATLLQHQGRFWLFANIKEPGGSSLNALHLFWSADPFSQAWTPHPRNPVVADVRSTRPAGRIMTTASSPVSV